jgi:sigma-E factor negative regulatory protein RseB
VPVTMLKHKTILAVWLTLAATCALADPLAQDDVSWLKKMVSAAHKTDYIGTFIYQSGSYVETSRITHLADGENEHERLEGLDGERSEVIRKNDQVWCYLGDSKVMVAKREGARTFPALLPEQLALLQENYVILHSEEDRVAGFHTHSVTFKPRDKMRYSHKMWAHSETGLLLKAVVLDEREHVIEQYAFTQLSIGGDIDRKWIVANKSTDRNASGNTVSPHSVHTLPADSGWMVYALPTGFKKMTEVSRNLHGSQLPVTHLAYSDGLAGISVFIEKLGEKSDVKPGLYGKGALQVFIRILDGNLLTVVGEVPPRTVIQVAESVRYGGQAK